MNLIAIIGIIDAIKKNDKKTTDVSLKVQKPFMNGDLTEDFYEYITIQIDSNIFKNELNIMNNGDLLGLKGRIKNIDNNLKIVAERLQLF